MSELVVTRSNVQALRWKFLATASSLAFFGHFGVATAAPDNDSDQPVVWIELGGQLDFLSDSQQRFAPPFFAKIPQTGFTSPLTLEGPSNYDIEKDGKIVFQPNESDWIFSASIRYGRNSGNGFRHEQTSNLVGYFPIHNPTLARHRYAETTTSSNETHDIADFMAGRDVGLGASASLLSGGFRFAQFRSQSSAAVYADPDYNNPIKPSGFIPTQPKYFHNFGARVQNKASFTGVGPALSWGASLPLNSKTQNAQISFDWGLNGAVLFGRQKSKGSHQTNGKLSTGIGIAAFGLHYHTTHYTHSVQHDRSRMVAVPNVGAVAGLSFCYANAKVSLGYRADLFFGAMDGGIDTRKSENVGFYGPFANVSIGFGG